MHDSNPIAELRAALAGRYDIEHEIGSGGMATVYLARDTRHNRSVAVKVLNPELGAILGVERFLAEIEVTANLQHPNLLPLFDSGEAAGLLFYVMPFVDGESLRARLDREKQLPVEEAIRIAVAVANALGYAHSHNVIHRDLKPENILLQSGQPVIADFGIALAVSKAGGNRITQTGLSLGTPAYMSPEQATGDRTIDGRSDIYSLAALTFEMLTGEPPHTGNTAQAVIARILTENPRSIRSTRPSVPEHVELAVLHALEKLPADRWQSAEQFAEALQGRSATQSLKRTSTAKGGVGLSTDSTGWRGELRRPVTLLLGATIVVLLVLGAWSSSQKQTVLSPATVRFPVALPSNATIQEAAGASITFSPDGRVLAFIAREGATNKVFVRTLDNDVAHSLPGTDGAVQPFFSPDGRWIGFWSGKLQKVAVDGSSVLPLAEVPSVTGVSWSPSGVIVFSNGNSLFTIPDVGGTPTMLGVADTARGEFGRRFPVVLPDGETVLYASASRGGVSSSKIAIVSLKTGKSTILDLEGVYPLGVVDGLLVYATFASTLYAVPFDTQKSRVTGPWAPIATNVFVGSGGGAKAGLSRTGALAFQGSASSSQIVMVDSRTGAETAMIAEAGAYVYPRFSPDGKRFAYTVITGGRSDVSIYNIATRTSTRLTSGGTINERSEWSPDGASVLFLSDRGGRRALWMQRSDFTGAASLLLGSDSASYYEGVLTRDSLLVYQVDTTGSDVYWQKLGDTTSHPVAVSVYADERARVSPDGEWVAFVSNPSGPYQVFVQPLPGPGARTPVSPSGGNEPVWAGQGTSPRLFFRDGLKFVEAIFVTAPAFRVDSLRTLFTDIYASAFSPHANYDVSSDGSKFLLVKPLETARIMIVLNWLSELRIRTGQK